MIELDPKKLSLRETYSLLIDVIVPRPIAFVSTANSKGQLNLAAFSFFTGVGSNPPSLLFSAARKRDGHKKDTLINAEELREFVVNVSSEWMAKAVHQSGAAYPYGVSEFEKVGLTPTPSKLVKPPRVAEAAVQMECKLIKTVDIGPGGPGSVTLVVGEVVYFHVRDDLYKEGRVTAEKLQPIARMGGQDYTRLGEVFSQPPAKVD